MVSHRLEWRFKEFMAREGLTIYALSEVLEGKVARTTLYRWQRKPRYLDLETLEWVLWGLEHLLGRRVTLAEFLRER